MAQVKKLEIEERDLRAKAGANLRAGNRDAAGQYALRLQTIQRELAENQTQLEQAEETYKNLLKARDVSISAARAKLENLKASITDMKMKQAMAELSEMSAGMISNIGGSGDTLDRLTEMVNEERDKAAGRARVAKDSLDFSGVQIKEVEQKALADQALADFAAQEGIAIESGGTAAPKPAEKTMGPAQKVTEK
jgi:phage shock protein A